MTEPNLAEGGPDSASAPICPWCSAPLRTGREESCPSCGAALHEAAEGDLPGVTRVDHEAILKSRAPGPRGRGLIGWLSGEYESEAASDSSDSIAPPDQAVRREMNRLELAALEAEVQARHAEAAAELAEAHKVVDGPDSADGTTDEGDPATTSDDTAEPVATGAATPPESAPQDATAD